MKTFPFNEQVQRGTLNLFKNDEHFFADISPLIKEGYFEYPAHQVIFRVVKRYRIEFGNLPTNPIILEECRKEAEDEDEEINLADFEDELDLIDSVTVESLDNRAYYLDLIEKFAQEKAMVDAIKKSVIHIKNKNPGAIRAEIEAAYQVNRNVDLGTNLYDDPDSRWGPEAAATRKYKTFITRINELLEGGLERKEMGIVVAPPGRGKSLCLANQGVATLMEDLNVGHISCEMAEHKVAQRYDAIITQLPISGMASNRLKLAQRMGMFRERYPNARLMIKEYPDRVATCNDIRALLNQWALYEDFVPDLLIVDYLELLRPCTSMEKEYAAQEIIAAEFRGILKEYNMFGWTATQTNREGRRVKLITDAELGDSYGKIRPADFVFSFNQTDEEYEIGKARAYIMKARNASRGGVIPLDVNKSTLTISQEGPRDSDEIGL